MRASPRPHIVHTHTRKDTNGGTYTVANFHRGRRRNIYQERSKPPSYLIGVHLPIVTPNTQSPKHSARAEISQLLAGEINEYIVDNNLALKSTESK